MGKIEDSYLDVTLMIFKDDSIEWSISDPKARELISILYPFIDIETRHIDLYDWNRVWNLISQLSSFNIKKLSNDDVVEYLDQKIANGSGNYKEYVGKVEGIIDTKNYSYRDRVLNYIKVGLKGHDFLNLGEELTIQSDGTNSHKYIEIILKLLVVLTRREYITPTIYIDEPEVGLHPKLNENLLKTLSDIYHKYEKTKPEKETGKYATPYPKIIFATHSPNILKYSVKLFKDKQQVIHFSKADGVGTKINKLNSHYSDRRFLNIFSDNEARLFFSNFILFVEGATELELFSNDKLCSKFDFLNKIDIYATNDLAIKYLNPSYSNAAIPFLVLNDLDVLVSFDYINKKLFLKSQKFNLDYYRKKSKLSYFSHDAFKDKSTLKFIFDHDGRSLDFLNDGIMFDKFSVERYVNAINSLLSKDNVRLVNTTIEGLLINVDSIKLFERWLCNKLINEMNYSERNPNPTRRLTALHSEIVSGRKDSSVVLNKILSERNDNVLSASDSLILKKIKMLHLKKAAMRVSSFSRDPRVRVNFYRVVFEGKTDTLLSRHNDAYLSTVSSRFSNLVRLFRTEILLFMSGCMGKTGGWVTEFLDFSIEEISKASTDSRDFERKFSVAFNELHSILKRVSSSIE